jgi:hypothetical protein
MEDQNMSFEFYNPIELLGMDAYTSEGMEFSTLELMQELTDEDLEDWALAVESQAAACPVWKDELTCF